MMSGSNEDNSVKIYCLDICRTGVAVLSIVTFVSGFYNGGHVGCYEGGLSELCNKCVTDVQKGSISAQ
jgi:hypothetical protein